MPVVAEQDFYDVYLSKGVLIEAQLIAERLQRLRDAGGRAHPERQRVVQIVRRGDIGEDAAAELRRALPSHAFELVDRVLEPGSDATRLQEALSASGPGGALILWLRPGDLASLPAQPPAEAAVFVSGIMAGLERAPLAGPWRATAWMAYPFDLPERRRARMAYPLGWMQFKQIPVVDERTQADTYLACLATAETVRLEMHLGTRLLTGYYPRVGLAAGQRFASKGGFLVRFAGPDGTHLVADGDWSSP